VFLSAAPVGDEAKNTHGTIWPAFVRRECSACRVSSSVRRSSVSAITLAIHLVVHLARLDARRVVTEVVRVRGYDPQVDRFIVEPWPCGAMVQEGAPV
jgi:hypothetical protein